MDSVKLMNRTDRKYWFSVEHLASLLDDIKDSYYLLEIDGKRNMPYSTTYYDTTEDNMYNNHHRGKMNRFKIRKRSYLSTGISFLEVKFKSNKGRTIKERIDSNHEGESFDSREQSFISENTPYKCVDLHNVLENGFRRLMLVSKAMNERCTIDSELNFTGNGTQANLEGLVVVEVKTEGRSRSPMIEALSRRHLHCSGFSKYCVGRSIIDGSLRINRFKSKHRELEKKIHKPIKELINYGN